MNAIFQPNCSDAKVKVLRFIRKYINLYPALSYH